MDALRCFATLPPSSSPRPSLLSSSALLGPSSLSSPCPQWRRRPHRSIKASSRVDSTTTLSEGWDVSGSVARPSFLPRFEELDTTNMLLRQRIVFLGSQVDTDTADFIISQLLFLDAEDQKKDIKLFINSPGGSVTAGMGIYDAMKLCKADISTVCFGLAASMGAFLLASGTKGKRFCMPNARVMIHQPLGTAGGKTTDMGLQIREMMYHKVKMNKILSRITGKPEQQIEIDTDRDNFMNPWQAKEYGLVDEVIDDSKPGLVAPIADAAAPPKTKVWSLWKVEGSRKAKKNLPSEHNISRNGYEGSDGSDGEKGTPQTEEAPTPV
ncbi:ATP-dependent Clp protease proteolytic subunit 3, chloroplastic [Dioscorea cayenensis subsp. rotundata]|uniref:ATP-dependent Clp protease proteolytic subunit n=1 Tax=Dioscorea cayennensis subsp. rotundata TaxID=55577 RepID=A0AB40AN73_DIOCR|nr:ATP-dependent Clp protease proteolytic subunit 3, chloroplastic [Dioscorea cayenensis subsp. rotundata]